MKMAVAENIVFLLLQSICGGASGYVTNKYAVNMLFKEYTPLKIGGAIRKNKAKFIEEISDLVERDIINGKTVKDKIQSDEFKQSIKVLVDDFFDLKAESEFDDVQLNEIPGYDNTREGVINGFNNTLNKYYDDFFENLSSQINVNEVINDKVIDSLCEKIYEKIEFFINDNLKVNEALNCVYEDVAQMKLKHLINSKDKENIRISVNNIISSVIDEYINNNLKEILDLFKSKDILQGAIEKLKNKNLSEIIDKNDINEFVKNVINLLNDSEMQQGVNNSLQALLNNIMQLDVSVDDIINEEVYNKILYVMEDKIKNVSPYFSEFAYDNNEKINALIETSVSEAMESYDINIRNLVISKVRNIIGSSNNNENIIIEKIKNYIENIKLNKNEEKIKNDLKESLKKIKIRNVFSTMDSDEISRIVFNDKNREIIVDLICNLKISDYLEKFDFEFLYDKFEEVIKIILLKEKDRLSLLIKKYTDNMIFNLFEKNIKALNVFNNKEDFKQVLSKEYKDNKEIVINELSYKISEIIKNVKLVEIFKNYETKDKLIKYALNNIEDYIEKNENIKMKVAISKLFKIKGIKEYAYKEFYNYINNNINSILKGKIKKTVYDNLITFDEDEICSLAQKFMGNELRPLSIFGGILGFIAGFIFGIFNRNIGLTGFYSTPVATIFSCVLMGFIGVITNIIALKMLFYPYKRNEFLAKIPFLKRFSLGYIPAHRESLASSIGNVIENELLSEEVVTKLFKCQKEIISAKIINSLDENNYSDIVKYVENNRDKISFEVYKKIINYLKDSKTIENKMFNSVKDYKLYNFIKSEEFNYFINDNKDIYNTAQDVIEKKVKENIGNVKDKITIKAKEAVNVYFEEQNELFNNEKIKQLILNGNEFYSKLINSSINQIMKKNHSSLLENMCAQQCYNMVSQKTDSILIFALNSYLKSEFETDKNIGEIFNGNVQKAYINNSEEVCSQVCKAIIQYLKNNRLEITELLKNVISDNLNFLEKAMFAMAGGNKIVERCADILIDKNIPMFLRDEHDNISPRIAKFMNDEIFNMNVSELNISSSDFKISSVCTILSDYLRNDCEYNENIYKLCQNVFKYLLNADITVLINNMQIDDVSSFYLKYENIFNYIISALNVKAEENKENIKNYVFEEIHKNTENNEFSFLSQIDYKYISTSLLNKIIENVYICDNKHIIVKEFYNEVSGIKVDSIVSQEYIKITVENLVRSIIENNDFNNKNVCIISKVIKDYADDEFKVLDINSKSYVMSCIIDSAVNCTILHMNTILKAASVKDVAVTQISSMDSKEIHMLFNSFCDDYFKKLYMYGSFGAVFGINIYAALILFAADEIISDDK